MPDSSLVPRDPNVLTKTQARRLEQDQYIAWLVQSDASDARCYFELARYATRKHEKGEMIGGAVVGFVSGLLLGGGSWPGSLAVGIAAFLATLLLIFLVHWIHAPSAFYRHARAELGSTKLLLQQEQARNAKPQLTGDIECLEIDLHPNIKDNDYDCFLTFPLTLRNGSAAATMVSHFELELVFKDQPYVSIDEPVDGFYVETRHRQPGKSGTTFEPHPEPLTAFPYDKQITNIGHLKGWLRFSVGSMPPDAVARGYLLDEVVLKLTAFDSRREPHLIYESSTDLARCGKIARRELKMY